MQVIDLCGSSSDSAPEVEVVTSAITWMKKKRKREKLRERRETMKRAKCDGTITMENIETENKLRFLMECPICLDNFSRDLMVALPCGHIYHEKCAKDWLRRATSCPSCLSKSSLRDLQRLRIGSSSSESSYGGSSSITTTEAAEQDILALKKGLRCSGCGRKHGTNVPFVTACGHIFCEACSDCAAETEKCPLCSATLPKSVRARRLYWL